jgi:small nuclear ribonucleoprotein D3
MPTPSSSSTIPLQVLHEAIGHAVAVELSSKEEYRGTLTAAEDSMNVTLQNVTLTGKDGRKTTLEEVYLRGSSIRLFVLPSALANAPVLKLVGQIKKDAPPAKKKQRVA